MFASLPESVDVERMVAGRRSFEGVIQVAELPRLVEALAGDRGEVTFRLDFEQGDLGNLQLRVKLQTRLLLVCQRTLEPFEFPTKVDTRLGLLVDERGAEALPADCEPSLLHDGKLSPRRVIEDELLLVLPQVPVKPGGQMSRGEWSTPREDTQDVEDDEAVTHPFADLRHLLGAHENRRLK